jgi:predicted Zn-dependent protease
VAVLLIAACGTTDVLPPEVHPEGEDRYLLHPLWGRTVPAEAANRFEAAYRHALSGNETEARRRIVAIRQRHPDLLASTHLLEALIDIRAGRLDEALVALQRVRELEPDHPLAMVYEAEIAIRQRQTRIAWDLYRRLPTIPTASERLTQLNDILFNELYAAAQTAPDAEAVRLLREALIFNASAVEPRVLLAQKLVSQRSFDEARREVEPLLNASADRPDVQEILAEIDVGRGRYQEAIVRYDRLARRTKEPRHQQRLEQI